MRQGGDEGGQLLCERVRFSTINNILSSLEGHLRLPMKRMSGWCIGTEEDAGRRWRCSILVGNVITDQSISGT